jgi:Ca-activated chloride channel family protein
MAQSTSPSHGPSYDAAWNKCYQAATLEPYGAALHKMIGEARGALRKRADKFATGSSYEEDRDLWLSRTAGVLSLNRDVTMRFSLACVAVLMFAWFAQAQSSLDDVHVEPRQKPNTEASPRDAVAPRGLPSLETHIKPLRVDVDLVLVPVTVTDAMNRPVTALQKQDFKLYEGEKLQQIRYFFQEEEPLSVAVLLDVSKSMSDKIATEREALQDFFNNANPEDEYFEITFSDRPRLVASSTNSIEELQRPLTLAEPAGPTAMLDAIYLAEAQLRTAKYKRRAIVIFSDGGDNVSRHSHREIRGLVRERDVEVYAIGLFEPPPFGSVEEKLGKIWLSQITDCTGGRTVAIQKREKVPEAAAAVSREIRSQYVLGYHPSNDRDGKWRKIRVRVASATAQQPLRASYKQGYISLEK